MPDISIPGYLLISMGTIFLVFSNFGLNPTTLLISLLVIINLVIWYKARIVLVTQLLKELNQKNDTDN